MSRASMKAKKTWHRRKKRSVFHGRQRFEVQGRGRSHFHGGSGKFEGGAIDDLPAIINAINRFFRGRSTPRGG